MMSAHKAVVFIGHNECFDVSLPLLQQNVENCVKNGYSVFMSGGQGGFDRLSATAVYQVKQSFPYIKNILVIPYLTFRIFDKSIFDEIVYPNDFEKYHFKAAIPARNRYLVDNADLAITYIRHTWGGAATTYAYAKSRQLKMIEL